MKKNNKGFSLVELIIVIAIMAVLVAVLAPQYIQYVDKSRRSVDISAADNIVGACKTIAVDPEYYEAAEGGFVVTWADDGTISVKVGETANALLTTGITSIVGTNIEGKAKDFAVTTFTYNATTNTVAVDGATYIETAFS